MAGEKSSLLEQAYEAFAVKAKFLRERAGLSQEQVRAGIKARGIKLAQKSVSNIENQIHDSQLSTFQAMAEFFGVPLWVMFHPGLRSEIFESDRLSRLVKLIDHYFACSDEERKQIEGVANGYAGLHKKP